MSSHHILANFVNPIARTKGLKNKQAKLKSLMDTEDFSIFQKIMVMSYDPMLTFNFSSGALAECTVTVARRSATGAALHENSRKFDGDKAHFERDIFPVLETLLARKFSGNQLKDYIGNQIEKYFSHKDLELLHMILNKDLRMGLGAASINKVIPGLLFDFHVMLASAFDGGSLEFPVFVEPKFDGMRALSVIKGSGKDSGDLQMFTRSGHTIDVERLPDHLIVELKTLAYHLCRELGHTAVVIDGELMGTSFQDTMKNARKETGKFETAKFYGFDTLGLEEFYKMQGQSKMAYKDRRASLRKAFDESFPDGNAKHVFLPQAYLVSSEAEIQSYFDVFRTRGYEGLIVKKANGKYRLRRHADWMKMKSFETLDLPIVGAVEGKGKYVGSLGALIVNHKGVHVNIGTGLSDSQRKEIWEDWLSAKSMLGTLIEVGYQEITPDNSLRHPRFIRFRADKERVSEEAWG